MVQRKAALLFICLFKIVCLTQSSQQLLRSFTPAAEAEMKDLAISSDAKQLFASSSVSDRSAVYRLNSSFDTQEVLWISEGLSVLGITLTLDASKLVVCLSDKSCTSYDASNLKDGSSTVFPIALAGNGSSVALVSAPVIGGGNSFYAASSNDTVNLIGQYGLDRTVRNVSRSSGGLFDVTAVSFARNWFGGFVAGSYVYFVVLDVSASPNSETGIRVLRVCDNSQETRVTSVSEIELDCLDLAGRVNGYARLVGASLVTYPVNGSESYETALLVGIVTPPLGGYSGMYSGRVCAFRLSQIDSMIDSVSSSSPSNGTCFSGPLPWRNTSNSYFSCSSRCNMSSPGATEAPTLHAVSHPVSVLSTNTSFELDYVLSIYIESLSLLFIASTNRMGASILQTFHVTDGSANSTGNLFSSWVLPQRAIKLTWISGLSYIYVTTNISVIQVPFEQCSNLIGCLSCVVNVNPLCGWCTVEQKCSRRSQCQNSTKETSWIQDDSNQCHTNVTAAMINDSKNFTYTSVIPTNTIPSGGINLNFIGKFPDTTLKAVFVVTNGNTSECEQHFGRLICIAPPLGPIDFFGPAVYLVAGVDYTIVMEGVPGPVGDSLNLAVFPDPVFLSIREDDQTQTAGSVKPIRIDGYYISNVNAQFEISVTIDGEMCQVDVGTTTDTTLTCQPPQFLSAQFSFNAQVRVTVGKYLSYTPGNITLLVTSKAEAFPIAPSVGGSVAGLFLLLLALVLIVTTVLVINRQRFLHRGNSAGGLMIDLVIKNEGLKTAGHGNMEMADFMRHYRGAIIPSDHILVLNAIGNGEFGVVYKAHIIKEETDYHQVVALKTLKGLFTMRDLHNMMSEILKMQDFSHPHVMTLMGMSFDAANTPSMVMPYMANGSLLSYLKMNRPLLLVADTADVKKLHASEKLLTRISYQVAQGMEYLSAQKFVHRDLAARNCMIDADGVIKVGDFGLSEDVYISGYFRLDKESRGVKLPFKWLAPESIQDGLFNEKTDMLALKQCEPEVAMPQIMTVHFRYSLMLRCWDSDPEDRPTFAKIAITISKALQIMSDYLDLSMIGNQMQYTQNGNQEPAIANTIVQQMSTRVAAGNEPETTIQTTVCEAYADMSRKDYCRAIVTKMIALDGTEAQEMMPLEGPSSLSPRYVDDISASDGINNPPAIVSRSTDDSTKFVLDGGAMTKGTQLQLSEFNSRSPKQSYQMEIAGRWNDLVMNVAGGNPTADRKLSMAFLDQGEEVVEKKQGPEQYLEEWCWRNTRAVLLVLFVEQCFNGLFPRLFSSI
ncbi:hypothetical protein EMCRGX_G025977 [Ephydatia muelleri]